MVGTNYRKVSDDCFSDLERRQRERREREERVRRSRSLGRLSAARRRVADTGAPPSAVQNDAAVSASLEARYSRYSTPTRNGGSLKPDHSGCSHLLTMFSEPG